jgi:hypothetical protein
MVHGIGRDVAAATIADLDLPDVERVEGGALVAVVTPTDADEAMPTRANLLMHTRILEQLGARTTVVPMRFGVVVPDAETLVRDFLEPERERLEAALTRLDGHVELRLRGRYVEPEVIREVLVDDPRAARLRGQRSTEAKMELGERIVDGIARRRPADRDRAVAALSPNSAANDEGTISEPLDAFTLSFLVADADRARFELAVDELGDDLAPVVRLELVGPVPPFSFASDEEGSWA